ncbi:MAG: hypothetical protein WDZ40_02565 [Candidatus Spechtbacterales bacterium]
MKKILVRQLLKKYKPRLVVVFGRYGRQETRSAVQLVISRHFRSFDSSEDRFFSEFYENLGGFFGILIFLFLKGDFPQFCIIDADPDSHNFAEIKKTLKIDLAVVVAVGDIPSYTDVFAGAQKRSEKIIREARKAVNMVYIHDDETIYDLVREIPIAKRSFGFSDGAAIRAESPANWIYIKQKVSGGVALKVERDGSLIPFNLINCYGKRNIYASLAALGAALFYDINFVDATQYLGNYEPPAHSFTLHNSIKSSALITHIFDVTPLSAREAIEFLGELREEEEVHRLVIILGDVFLRANAESEGLHRVLGELAAHNADELILVGDKVIFTEEEAKKYGMEEQKISRFITAEDAGHKIDKKIKKGDAILVLGSHSVEMEKIVEILIEK